MYRVSVLTTPFRNDQCCKVLLLCTVVLQRTEARNAKRDEHLSSE